MSDFVAHDAAYFDANILHRDISTENIIISEDGGVLIDWDKSIRVGPGAVIKEGGKDCMYLPFLKDCLVINVSDFVGNVAIHVSSSAPE